MGAAGRICRPTNGQGAACPVDLSGDHVGQPVVLAFESGDPLRPIVLGVLPGRRRAATVTASVDADLDHVVVTAQQKLVLRCGSASITLTSAGKIIIDGAYVVSRASGTNRILGGSIQLN
jgi:hypothetical protein